MPAPSFPGVDRRFCSRNSNNESDSPVTSLDGYNLHAIMVIGRIAEGKKVLDGLRLDGIFLRDELGLSGPRFSIVEEVQVTSGDDVTDYS